MWKRAIFPDEVSLTKTITDLFTYVYSLFHNLSKNKNKSQIDSQYNQYGEVFIRVVVYITAHEGYPHFRKIYRNSWAKFATYLEKSKGDGIMFK